jgi:spore maturation protein CgeB
MKLPERVLLVHPGPQFSVHDVYIGWVEAFSDLGVKCGQYNLEDRIAFHDSAYAYTGVHDEQGHAQFRKAIPSKDDVIRLSANGIFSTCFQWWPDLVIVVSAFFVPSEYVDTIRSRGIRTVGLFTESPYEEERQLEKAAHYDLVMLNDPARLAEYDAAGIRAIWMPHAYRPRFHYPGPGQDDLQTDFAFIGTMYPGRVRFFERMMRAGGFEGLDITLGGNVASVDPSHALFRYISHDANECVDNELATMVYRSAKVGLNIYRDEVTDSFHGGYAAGPREIEMAACGLFFLREPRPESDETFPMLPTYSSPEEAAEQLQWWVTHDGERRELAMKARAAIRPRTFRSNAVRLLEVLDGMF